MRWPSVMWNLQNHLRLTTQEAPNPDQVTGHMRSLSHHGGLFGLLNFPARCCLVRFWNPHTSSCFDLRALFLCSIFGTSTIFSLIAILKNECLHEIKKLGQSFAIAELLIMLNKKKKTKFNSIIPLCLSSVKDTNWIYRGLILIQVGN